MIKPFQEVVINTIRSAPDNRSSNGLEHDHMIILSNPRFKYIGEPQENAESHMNYMTFEYFFVRFNYFSLC